MKIKLLFFAMIMSAFSSGLFAQADAQETVAIIKKDLLDSKDKIKQYEWLETTTTFMNGEKKSVKQNQCYYSVDGKLTKVATGATTQAKTPGGIRGKVVANKKEEMADYIKAAIDKIQTYLPPDAAKVQQIYGAGQSTVQVLEPAKKFKLNLPDYNEKGDMLSISLDKANQKIIAISVNTFIDDPSQKVVFDITIGNLPDGTQYAGSTTLDAQAKKLKIVIVNSGYKKGSGK